MSVHSESQVVDLHFDGEVIIDGLLAISQEALPPGGHMDVTTLRSLSGDWPDARGTELQGSKPFHRHRHRYDLHLAPYNSGEPIRTLFYRDSSLPSSAANYLDGFTRFNNTLSNLTGELIALEFDHFDGSHGHALWTLTLNGTTYNGSVKNGFGDAAFSADMPHRTSWFTPSDLQDFIVNIQSLRALRQSWDGYPSGQSGPLCYPFGVGGGQGLWPGCVSRHWDRGNALTMRIIRESDRKTVYENATYWHLRQDELQAHIDSEEAWRDSIQGGATYGVNFRLGADASLNYNEASIIAAGERLKFDPAGLIHRASGVIRRSVAQAGG